MKKLLSLIALYSLLLSGCSNAETVAETKSYHSPPLLALSAINEPAYEANWNTRFNKKDLADAALENASSFYAAHLDIPSSVSAIFDDTLSDEMQSCTSNAAEEMIDAFSAYLEEDFKKLNHYLVVGREDWLVENVMGLPISDWPSQNHYGDEVSFNQWMSGMVKEGSSFSTTFGHAEKNVVIISPGAGFYKNCQMMEHLVYHETFHMISLQLDDRSLMGFKLDEAETFGLWFVEGSADFFAETLASFLNNKNYYGRSPDRAPGDLQQHSSTFSSERVYGLGHLAIEFIVANIGVEPVMDVYRYIGMGNDFNSAFELGIGMTVEEFYLIYDSIEITY